MIIKVFINIVYMVINYAKRWTDFGYLAPTRSLSEDGLAELDACDIMPAGSSGCGPAAGPQL